MQFRQGGITQNSKGLTRTHGQSVELGNCEFFIMAGRGYLHFTVHSNLAHLLFCPRAIVNALQKCSLFTFPFLFYFLLSSSPLYHKSKMLQILIEQHRDYSSLPS